MVGSYSLHGIKKRSLILLAALCCSPFFFLHCSLLAISTAMDVNPQFKFNVPSVDSSPVSSIDRDAPTISPPPAAVLQTVNIKYDVPIVLELAEPNYDEWRYFFDAFIGKFGLGSDTSPPCLLRSNGVIRNGASWINAS